MEDEIKALEVKYANLCAMLGEIVWRYEVKKPELQEEMAELQKKHQELDLKSKEAKNAPQREAKSA